MANCNHPGVLPEIHAENLQDGSRRLYVRLRCCECQRLAKFRGFEGIAGAERPVVTEADRYLSIPFGFGGSYIGD